MTKHLQKFTAVLLAAIMTLGVFAVVPFTASAATSGDFEYEILDDSTAKITGYTGTAAELTLPSEIDGYKVISIGEYAFGFWSSLTNITIPDSVTSIGDNAFSACWSLTSITIPNSVTSIGDNAFADCTGLTNITIPNSVTSIGDHAFESCTSLTSITIPNSVTSIGDLAFCECSSLTSITVLDGVTSIGDWAFCECSSLTSITIPDSVTSIGGEAFSGTAWFDNQPDGLVYAGKVAYTYKGEMPENTSLTIKDGTKIIAEWVFYSCTNLTSITIPISVTSIGYSAFEDCENLTDVYYAGSKGDWKKIDISYYNDCLTYATIHYAKTTPWDDYDYTVLDDGTIEITGYYGTETDLEIISEIDGTPVTSIGWATFTGYTNLTSVTIPSSVTSIGYDAFNGCTNLTSIIIPDSVTSIGDKAFGSCNSLTKINISQNNSKYTSENGVLLNKDKTEIICFPAGKQDTSYSIPDTVTIIRGGAFAGCTNLASITIGNSVTNIEIWSFSNCFALSDVYYKGTEEEWKSIDIVEDHNYYFINATIHFNVTGYNPTNPTNPTDPDNPSTPSLGDIDGDGKISVNDVTDIQKYIVKLKPFTDEQMKFADVDKNGKIDVNDVTLLQKVIVKIAVI